MTERSSPASPGQGRRGAIETRMQSRSTPSEAKPNSYRYWDLYTTGQLVDGLQQKKKTEIE